MVFTLALLRFAYRNSGFFGDDLTTFRSFQRLPFRGWVLALLGGQLVPLHRIVTFLTYRAARMRFSVALAVVGLFHAVGVAYLYRTLALLRETRMNAVVVAFYATYVFIGIQLTWFSSAMTRFPYIALSLMAIYHYLSFARTARLRELLWVAVCGVLSLGFYAKGILVPLACVSADLAAPSARTLSSRERRLKWATVMALVVIGAAYASFARSLLPSALARSVNTDLGFQLNFQRGCWAVLFHSLFDHVLVYGSTASRAAAAPWILLVVYAFWRAPASRVALVCGALLVSINFAIVGLSSRTLVFKGFMVYEHRHYLEVCFVLILFLGIALHGMREAPEVRWVLSQRVAPGLVVVLLCVHAVASYSALAPLLKGRLYEDMPRSREFLMTLMADLATLDTSDGRVPTFVDGTFPLFLDPLDLTFRRYSELFPVLGVNARFEPVGRARYVVGQDGHVRRAPRR